MKNFILQKMMCSLFMVLGMAIPQMAVATDLETVSSLDLGRYLGKWYEVASMPQFFQKDCTATTATYSLREDGDIQVLNECHVGSITGPMKSAKAKAWQPDASEPGKLKVQFFWPFSAHYWIIDLAEDYSYAVVSHPSRDYLWILSRTPHMDELVFQEILNKLKNKNFDLSKIQRSVQP